MEEEIVKIIGREIIDSRGYPTVEAELHTKHRIVYASVPSGASTGKFEAHELRDGDNKRFMGKGVLKAVNNINTIISSALIGQDAVDQKKIDEMLIELDGTKDKSRLGANTILAVSIAVAKCTRHELYDPASLPVPLVNILNGGVHADNELAIQEFMIVPVNANSFKHAVQISAEIFHVLKKTLSDNSLSTNLGDEGGFAPQLKNHKEALDYIMQSIEKAGYKTAKDVYIALDAASSEFYKNNIYELKGKKKKLDSDQLIKFYEELTSSYPIISIEDPMAEDDLDGWKNITKCLGSKIQLVGDDLFVTNTTKLEEGINNDIANSILIKLNQIGTVTETKNAIALAKKNQYTTIVSHRSGETEDSFIAEFSAQTGSDQIKTGSMARSERLSKYNELIRIEERLDFIKYKGKYAFPFLK